VADVNRYLGVLSIQVEAKSSQSLPAGWDYPASMKLPKKAAKL